MVVRSTHVLRRGVTRGVGQPQAPTSAATVDALSPLPLPGPLDHANDPSRLTETHSHDESSRSALLVLGVVQAAWLVLLALTLLSVLR